MPDEHTNGARVTNGAIYDKLDKLAQQINGVDKKVDSLGQRVDEVVKPQLDDHKARIDRLEMRVYAITAGLLAASGIAKGIGLI